MVDKKKLEDLEAGDYVKLSLGTISEWKEIIERVTKTQIILKGGRYRKNSGYKVGAGIWDKSKIIPYTDEHEKTRLDRLKLYKKKNLIEELGSLNAEYLSDEGFSILIDALGKLHSRVDCDGV